MSNDKNTRKDDLLKRVYDLINNGEGNAHLEVDGVEAQEIFEEIRKMRVSGEIA